MRAWLIKSIHWVVVMGLLGVLILITSGTLRTTATRLEECQESLVKAIDSSTQEAGDQHSKFMDVSRKFGECARLREDERTSCSDSLNSVTRIYESFLQDCEARLKKRR